MNTHTSIDLRASLVVPLAFEEAVACGPQGQVRHRLVHLLPDGVFSAQDGRPGTLEKSRVSQWTLNEKTALRLVAAFGNKRTPLVIDYEHQSLNTRQNGKPAPAAGWIEELHYLPGRGLFAKVDWTETALNFLEQREYRFISPVISFDPQTGEVTRLIAAALTNIPAIDGLTAVAATLNTNQETVMDLKQLALAVGLAETASEAEVMARVTAISAQAAQVAALTEQVAALSSGTADAGNTPDPKAYVPMDVFLASTVQVAALAQEIETLKAQGADTRLETAITAALSDGRLLKGQEAWARTLAKAAPEALETFLRTAKPIAALSNLQSGGKEPEKGTGEAFASLSDEEAYVCAQLGLKPEQMKGSK